MNYFLHSFLILLLMMVSSVAFSQEKEGNGANNLKFSGTININTNGISPIPAFSLDKPAIIGVFLLQKKRLGFHPEIAFSMGGRPWFISPRFTYKVVGREKFSFSVGTTYSLSYSYPGEFINNILKTTTKIGHYMLLQSTWLYSISAKAFISFKTLHGFGLKSASIQRGNFFILEGNINELRITDYLYYGLFPQLTYINLDGDTEGLFASGVFGMGHKKLPFFVSVQVSQPLVTNISPEPGFKWNIGISYNF